VFDSYIHRPSLDKTHQGEEEQQLKLNY